MTASEFTHYLNGIRDSLNGQPPNAAQWKLVCTALQSVFTKVTPVRYDAISLINPRGPQMSMEDGVPRLSNITVSC